LIPEAKLAINGGLHVGGESDPGNNNLLVDGNLRVDGKVGFNTAPDTDYRLSVNGYVKAGRFYDKDNTAYYLDPSGTSVLSRVSVHHIQEGSSIRLKKNIRPLEGALEKVLQLDGVYFTWKESGAAGMGFIAEEVGKVIPEAVTYEEDGEYASGMSYNHIIPVLVEAVKEQQALIDRQAVALDALTQRLEQLEAPIASRNGASA